MYFRHIIRFYLFILSICCCQSYIDLCEYWVRTGQQNAHPECYPNANWITKNQLFSEKHNKRKCGANETWACADCEISCAQLSKACPVTACKKACICSAGLARELAEGKCIRAEECNTDYGIVKGVKEIVPIIIKDVWGAIIQSVKTKHGLDGVYPLLNNTEIIEDTSQHNDTIIF